MKTISRYLDSKYILYAYFLILSSVAFFTITSDHREYGTFRAEEVAVVQKIIHPEYYNGKFFSIDIEEYNPYFNYTYIVAFIAKKFGYAENLWELGRIFWVFEKGLLILTLLMLCNHIFNKDKMVLAIAVTLFISYVDHEATQKSMAMPLFVLAIYYFIREKWIISAIFTASVFYLHIGMGVWWFGTAGLAFFYMLLIKKGASLRQVISFCLVTVALVLPVIYAYFLRTSNHEISDFTVEYFYYTQLWQSSPLLALTVTPLTFANQWLTFGIFYLGYKRLQDSGHDHKNVLLLAVSAAGLYVIQFIFADIFSSNFIILMQLTRAVQVIFIFGILFLPFLLASHIRRGHYVFFTAFMIVFLVFRTQKTFFISIFILMVYEIFEKHIKNFMGKIGDYLKLNGVYFKRIRARSDTLFQQPVIVALLLLVIFAAPKLATAQLKSHIKSLLRIHTAVNVDKEKDKRKFLYEDISRYFNEEIANGRALILYPFLEFDFPLFIPRHDSFISFHTPVYNLFYNLRGSYEFKSILENDLNYSIDRLFEDRTNNPKIFYERWDKMWKNLNEDIIMHWKKKYNLTHVIREKDLPLNFPIVYQNPFYVVYEIR